jgi:hypothetical protein
MTEQHGLKLVQAGIWTDSGSGYIEYASTLGGIKVANITGAAAPIGAVASGGGGGASAINDLTDAITMYSSASMYLGQGSGASSTSSENTALGWDSLGSVTTGNRNTALGARALQDENTGARNTAIGVNAMLDAQGANLNTAIGYRAMCKFKHCYWL